MELALGDMEQSREAVSAGDCHTVALHPQLDFGFIGCGAEKHAVPRHVVQQTGTEGVVRSALLTIKQYNCDFKF